MAARQWHWRGANALLPVPLGVAWLLFYKKATCRCSPARLKREKESEKKKKEEERRERKRRERRKEKEKKERKEEKKEKEEKTYGTRSNVEKLLDFAIEGKFYLYK
jgi:hypothetical protein